MRKDRVSLVIALLCGGMLWADVAPTTYDGYTLAPKESSEIRMQSEEVNIYCGDRCHVVATFEMWNETDKPVDLFVGFPVAYSSSKQEIYDFQVKINEKSTPPEIKRIRIEGAYNSTRWIWFGWDQSFPTGRTIIRVEYHIEPSYSYGQPWLNVYYRLDTGALWKGTIGRADITVHFEEPLATEQIREGTWPTGFRIDDNKVCWELADIEPQLQDNIQVQYMPFAIYRELERLRSRIEEDPQDEARVIDLARRYFALGPYKGMGGDYLPSPITAQEYDSILARITDPNDRTAFETYWRKTEKRPVFDKRTSAAKWSLWSPPLPGEYEIIHLISGGEPVHRILHIMDSAGYHPYEPEYVFKAKEMLERLLEKNPKNADAWMVYIENCYRFVYGSYDASTRWCPIAPRQREIIERAYAHCPSHEGIKAWQDFVTYSRPEAMVNQLRARLKAVHTVTAAPTDW